MNRTTIAAGLILLTSMVAQATQFTDPVLKDVGFSQKLGLELSHLLINGLFGQVYQGQWLISSDLADHFEVLNPTSATAQVRWDISALQDDPGPNFLVYVYLTDMAGDSTLYRVSHRNKLSGLSDGFQDVTIDGHTPLVDIAFVGTRNLPDSGATLPLLGMALAGLAWFSRKRRDGYDPRMEQ